MTSESLSTASPQSGELRAPDEGQQESERRVAFADAKLRFLSGCSMTLAKHVYVQSRILSEPLIPAAGEPGQGGNVRLTGAPQELGEGGSRISYLGKLRPGPSASCRGSWSPLGWGPVWDKEEIPNGPP